LFVNIIYIVTSSCNTPNISLQRVLYKTAQPWRQKSRPDLKHQVSDSSAELLYKKQSNTHYEYTLFSECANRYIFRSIRTSSGVYHNTKIVAHICIKRLKQWCYIKYIQLIKIYNVCMCLWNKLKAVLNVKVFRF
jgi:hypothetical protein